MEHETILTPEARRAILLKQRRQNKIIEFLFILAVIAYPITNFLIFYLYKNATSILMAFQQYDADYKLQWVGLENFKIFFKDLPAINDAVFSKYGIDDVEFLLSANSTSSTFTSVV